MHRHQLRHSLPLKLLLAREMTDHPLGLSAAMNLMMSTKPPTSTMQTARVETGWKTTVIEEHRRQTGSLPLGRGQGLHEGEHSLPPMAGQHHPWSDTVEALLQLDARTSEEPTKRIIHLKRLIIRQRCLQCISRLRTSLLKRPSLMLVAKSAEKHMKQQRERWRSMKITMMRARKRNAKRDQAEGTVRNTTI